MGNGVRKALLWLAVTGLMAAIFAFSAQPGDSSTQLTDSAVIPVAEWLMSIQEGNSEAAFQTLHFMLGTIVRKAAHVCEYALLGYLVYRLLKAYGHSRPWLAVVVCVIYAVTDEAHQFFVPGRTGSVTDVLIDSAGAAVGAFADKFTKYIRRKKHVHRR